MFRLLALLQLTRAALAFTAIADVWTVMLLRYPEQAPGEAMGWTILRMLIVSMVSASLYGFGMSLNDLLDARHDRLFAPRRPIPSGRIAPRTAIVISLVLLMVSLLAAAILSAMSGARWGEWVPWPFFFTFATAILIVFYDATSKYLGAIGILTLGGIRALHCLIGNPETPLLFLSMFLLTHVYVVSLVAYRLENKRPRLGRGDLILGWVGLGAGLGAAVYYMMKRGTFGHEVWGMLMGPAAAMGAFGVWAVWTCGRKGLTARKKGRRLMLMGVFWLFVYDASILFSNGQWLAALSVMVLSGCALVSFYALRWVGRTFSQPRVGYRVETAVGLKGVPGIPAVLGEK